MPGRFPLPPAQRARSLPRKGKPESSAPSALLPSLPLSGAASCCRRLETRRGESSTATVRVAGPRRAERETLRRSVILRRRRQLLPASLSGRCRLPEPQSGGQARRRGCCPACPDKAPSRSKGSPLTGSLQVLRAAERPRVRVPPRARIRQRCASWCRTLPAPSRPLSASVRQQGWEKNVPRMVAKGMEGGTGRQGQSPQLKD